MTIRHTLIAQALAANPIPKEGYEFKLDAWRDMGSSELFVKFMDRHDSTRYLKVLEDLTSGITIAINVMMLESENVIEIIARDDPSEIAMWDWILDDALRNKFTVEEPLWIRAYKAGLEKGRTLGPCK